MKSMLSGVVLSGVIGLSNVGAQPASTGNRQPATVTVTGCLQQGGASGTIGTTGGVEAAGGGTGTAGAGGQFVLMHAATVTSGTSGGAAASSPTIGDAGNTASPGRNVSSAGSVDVRYVLDGAKADLQPHIGHQVEIVGRFVASDTAGAHRASSPAQEKTPTVATHTEGQRLAVEKVRMTKSECASR